MFSSWLTVSHSPANSWAELAASATSAVNLSTWTGNDILEEHKVLECQPIILPCSYSPPLLPPPSPAFLSYLPLRSLPLWDQQLLPQSFEKHVQLYILQNVNWQRILFSDFQPVPTLFTCCHLPPPSNLNELKLKSLTIFSFKECSLFSQLKEEIICMIMYVRPFPASYRSLQHFLSKPHENSASPPHMEYAPSPHSLPF